MRKILISTKGEFKELSKSDLIRAYAVKKMASTIKRSEKEDEDNDVVVISGKVLQHVSA